MRQAVCQYAERAAEKLRGERQFCRHIAVFVKTSPFAVNEPYYGNVASEKLMKVVDGINHSGLGKVWFAGRGLRLSGK